MIKATDIAKVLTAAAPIVASIVAIANKTENVEKEKKEKEQESPVSVVIHNTFYTNSEDDAKRAAQIIKEQIDKANASETRYML